MTGNNFSHPWRIIRWLCREEETVGKQKMNVLLLVIILFCAITAPCFALENVSSEPAAWHILPGTPPAPVFTIPPGQSLNVTVRDKSVPSLVRKKAVDADGRLPPPEEKISTALLLEINGSSDVYGSQPISVPGLLIKTVAVPPFSAGSSDAKKIPSGRLVYVYISTEPGSSTHIADPLVAEVTDRDENSHLVVAWADAANLESIADLGGVQSIRQVTPPVVNTGSVTTQGDAIHKTADVRSLYGYRGAGMKIGIISDGVDHLADSQATGDLPAHVHVLANSFGGDEGTAMLEIVHDMVPDADLYFHDYGGNRLGFINTIAELKGAGCTVICDDLGWFDEPYFEDGIIALNVTTLLSENRVVYVSSAGNSADSHYLGAYYDNGNGYNDFSRGSSATLKSLYVFIPPGATANIYLEWDDQFGHSGNDYNLYLSDDSHSPATYGDLGYSENVQTGSGDPYETITFTNHGPSTVTGRIDVKKFSGATRTLNLYQYGSALYPPNLVAEDSIVGQQTVPDVVSVAAAPQYGPSELESFSSHGPVLIVYPSPESRPKPDITGVDGVNVTGAGGFARRFYGTSASAPHIAAVVAQIWGAHPELSPAEVRSALYRSAVDMGTPGRDNESGYGLADALAMARLTMPVVTGPDNRNNEYRETPEGSDAVVTGAPALPGIVSVNVGGSTRIFRVTINGTGVMELIVTSTRAPGPGTGVPPPAGIVLEYLDLTPARYTTISDAQISFFVPQSWLDENHLTPQDVVLEHSTGAGWVELPTGFVRTSGGNVYFVATSPGFSRFAIVGKADRSVSPLMTPAQASRDYADLPAAASGIRVTPAMTGIPASARTTVVPAGSLPAPGGLPLATVGLAVAGLVALIGCVFVVRRWWIRRQNPALFMKDD